MGLPTISQWIECIADPGGRFRTLGGFEPELDAYGTPRFTAGNNAAVFRIRIDGQRHMLKCYIREGRYRSDIYRSGVTADDPLLVPARLLAGEAFVHDDLGVGAFHDVVLAPWIEGSTLETAIKRAAREEGAPGFVRLAEGFDRLVRELLARKWAHGDLKPENIIVGPEGRMTLIDYDAIFLPGLAGKGAFEVGTPTYQHPARNETVFDLRIDDYPAALIGVSLHALALCPELYDRYNHGDNIILYPNEIATGNSPAYDEVLDLFARTGRFRLYALARSLRSPSHAIEGIMELFRNEEEGMSENNEPPEMFCRSGLWGYRDSEGATVIDPVFDEATGFAEGLAPVSIRGRWIVIDTAGHMVIEEQGVESLKPFGCGLAAFRKGGLWGYMDREGRTVVEPRYEMAGTMHEGRAAVKLDGRFGYIDRSGTMVIPLQYDRAMGFRDGKAIVYSGGDMAEIDLSGAPLPQPGKE